MYEADGFQFLEVQKVAVEDNGMYSVTVQNLAGSDTAEVELEVFEKPKLLTRSGPEWEQPLQDLTVEEGDVGVLVCTCRELIQPAVKWFHNEKEVFSGFHMKLQHVAQTATLTIKEIKERDAGQFKCIMTGKNGELVTSCTLTIKSPEKMEPPVFVKELQDMDVDEGDKLKLDVEVKGTSLVRIAWYHNNVEITHDNPQYKITSIGNIYTLTLLHATSESSGEYVCEAYNDIGGTDTFCFIDVREIKHPEPPEFVTHPMNLSTNVGETVTFTCQVKGQPMPTVLWKRRGVIMVTDRKFKITRIQDCHTLTIYNTDHTDAGEYICYLYNTNGDKSYVCKLQVPDQRYQQNIGSLSSRPDHSQEMQHSTGMGQHAQPFIEPTKGFRDQRMLHLENRSENDEIKTTRGALSMSNEYTVGSTATNLQTMKPHMDDETRERKHSSQSYSDSEPNLPNSTKNLQFVPSTIYQKAEDNKNVTDSNFTNYRSVLKQGQKSPFTHLEKSNESSYGMGLRTVLPQYKMNELKGDNPENKSVQDEVVNFDLNNVPLTKTSQSLFSHNGGYTSVSHTTPSLSSPLYLSSHENGGHKQKQFNVSRNETAAKNLEPAVVRKSFDFSGDANVLSLDSAEPSQMANQRWRRGLSGSFDNSEILITDRNDQSSLDAKKTTFKRDFQKVNLSQLSSRKLSTIEYNPSAPQSESLKLEVTSVSASVPQRQSLSSPRSHSESNNMTAPGQLSGQSKADNFHIKQEDDDVFTVSSKIRAFSYHEPKQSSRTDHDRHNVRSSTVTQETVPWGITDDMKESISKSYTHDSFNQTNETTDNRIKNSRIRFPENLPYYHDHSNQEDRRFSVVLRNETSSISDSSTLVSHMSPLGNDDTADDFRNVRLKSAAPKTKEKSDLSKTKFMSKSTESVFTDVKLKPVSQTNESLKKSNISSHADRIKANSKSSDLSKLFYTPHYQNPTRNNLTPRTNVAATSSTFKFSNNQKSFNDDAKPKSFIQTSRYQKPVQGNKFRTSAGKYEKALPGGVSRSNSHKKSKGIGAKFEAAVKDLNISKQVPYTSLHTAKNNQSDVKPLGQQKLIGYNSGRMSENLQNLKSAEVQSSEKDMKKAVNAANKPNSDNALLNNGSENYKENVSDWANKRHSLHTFTSNKSAFTNKERYSTINPLRVFEGDKQNLGTIGLNQMNKVSAPDVIQNVNVELQGNKYSKDADGKIRVNRAGIPEVEMNTDSRVDQQAVGYSTDATKLASRAVESARKPFQISSIEPHPQSVSKYERPYTSEELSYNTYSVPSVASVTLRLTNDDARTSEISKITVKPKVMEHIQSFPPMVTTSTVESRTGNVFPQTMVTKSQLVTSASNIIEPVTNITIPKVPNTSTSVNPEMKMLTPPWNMLGATESQLEEPKGNESLASTSMSNNLKGKADAISESAPNEYSPRQDSLEPQSDYLQPQLQNPRQSWMKQKSLRHIPLYPVNDNEMSSYNEPLKLSMYDSESLLSTASMSSSSSEASNVTVDSGYTRNHRRSHVANERIQAVSANLHPESNENWNRMVSPRDPIEGNRNQKAEMSDTENNFWNASMAKENIAVQSRENDLDRSKQKSEDLTADLKYAKVQTERETLLKSANVFKDSAHFIDVKEVELADDINDSITSKYISRRRNRQIENNVAVRSESALKSETGKLDKEREPSSDISNDIANPVTFEKSSWQKRMSVSPESSSGDDSLVRTKNTNVRQVFTTSEVKSDSTNSQATLNIEPRSQLDDEYEQQDIKRTVRKIDYEPEKPNDEHKLEAKDIEANVSIGQGESISTDRKRFKFRDKFNKINHTGDETTTIPDKPSLESSFEPDINQDVRSSRLHLNEFTLDHEVVPSMDSHQDNIRLSRSGVEMTSPVHATTFTPPPPSLFTITTSPTTFTPIHVASSSAVSTTQRQQQYCPPSFPIPLHDCSVMYGSKTVLLCHVVGNPRPDVKWLLNQKKVEPSDEVEIIYSDVIAQLTIQETSKEHTGDYTCWARNTLGTVSTHCTLSLEDNHNHITDNSTSSLTQAVIKSDASKMSVCLTNSNGTDQIITNISIEGVPDAPSGRPDVYVTDTCSASLSWSGPNSTVASQDIYYIIEAKTSEDKTWNVIIPQCKELFCIIQNLKSNTTYQFRVLAANRYGVSLPSEPSEKVITPDIYKSTNDYDYEGELPFKPRDVTINTKDKFEDLYHVENEVGKGKFGVVYKCKQKSDGTVWAAKVIRCRDKEKIGLRREIDIMNKLRHPKILLLWDAFESPRQMVLVMEYVGAGELFERVISDDFVLTEMDCIHFVRQTCEAVAYMHSNNILHLDLKPENILCVAENSNSIKIIDFGLAQFHKPGQSTRVLFGTPEFIAPEVINYDEIGFETDMWSLGVICYVLLSGLSPFLGDSDTETLANVTTAEYDFDDEAFEEITDLAKDFICRLLVKKKEKRMLTGRCLAHPWLNQDEVDGIPAKPLSTERLKKFMIRRKWLKTGNAVKAVSRLLKSNSLSGFGALDQNNSIDSDLDTPLPKNPLPASILQRTAEEDIDDEEDLHEIHSVENSSTSEISENLGCVYEKPLGAKISSFDEKHLSPRDQRNSNTMEASSKSNSTNLVSNEILTSSSEKRNAALLAEITSQEQIESISSIGITNNDVVNRNSRISSPKITDLHQNVANTRSASPSQSAIFEQLNASPSSSRSAEKNNLQINNRITEAKQVTSVTSDGVLPQAPIFTKPMIRCKTCAGDVARFDVVVSGNPFPQVTWFFEDEEILSDTRHTIRFNERLRSFSLIIRNIEEDDEGEYACKAVNSQGECTCVADLTVLQY